MSRAPLILFRPLPAVASSRAIVLARSAAYFALLSAAVLSLIASLPTQRFYATAAYAQSVFDYQVDGVMGRRELDYLASVAVPDTLVTYITLAPVGLSANGRSVDPAFVELTDQSALIERSWFPASLTVEETTVPGDWLDISAGAARALGVHAGDAIEVPFLDGAIHARVRRVMAVTLHDSAFVATGPVSDSARALLARADDGLSPTVATLRSSASAEAIRAGIGALGGKQDWTVTSRENALAAIPSDPSTSPPVLAVTSLIGVALLIALSIREAAYLVSRRSTDLAILLALGATRRQIVASLAALEGLATAAGLVVSFLLVTRAAYQYLFAPALPPPFEPVLVACLVGLAGAYVITLALASGRRLKTWRIVSELSATRNVH